MCYVSLWNESTFLKNAHEEPLKHLRLFIINKIARFSRTLVSFLRTL